MISIRSIFAVLAMSMCSIISVEAQGDFALAEIQEDYTASVSSEDFSTLVKNVNYRAAGLEHDLNETRDTLKLSSDRIIQRVYTVGDQGRAIDLWVNRKQRDIPLTELSKGKYVFVVEQDYKKIIFQVLIHQDNGLLSLDDSETRTAGVTSDNDPSSEDSNAVIDEQKLTKEISK